MKGGEFAMTKIWTPEQVQALRRIEAKLIKRGANPKSAYTLAEEQLEKQLDRRNDLKLLRKGK
jgi:hypothetical protein